jgi:hypothetical protein
VNVPCYAAIIKLSSQCGDAVLIRLESKISLLSKILLQGGSEKETRSKTSKYKYRESQEPLDGVLSLVRDSFRL